MILIGAIGQTMMFAILPARYAFLPSIGFLLHTLITIVLQMRDPHNSYMHGVMNTRVSAQLPAPSYNPNSKDSSLFGSKGAAHGVVVLMLGFRMSSPIGIFDQGGKEVGRQFGLCRKELDARAKEYGFLGASGWTSSETANHSTSMSVYYFRDIEGLNRFAQSKVHLDVWNWYNGVAKQVGYKHACVFHETFFSAPGQYETIYVNMPPVLMGATNVPAKNEATGEDEWIRPLVDANNTTLRSQWGRMGRAVKEDESEY